VICRFHVGAHHGTLATLVSPLNAHERPCPSISSEDDLLSTLERFLDSPEEVVSIGVAAHNACEDSSNQIQWIRRFYRAFAIVG
jgi:hypothetical protein